MIEAPATNAAGDKPGGKTETADNPPPPPPPPRDDPTIFTKDDQKKGTEKR